MASVATRTPKRELAPDWRDVLRDAARRFAVRLGGGALLALALITAIALITHDPTDPSWTTAAGGPPQNWAGQYGAYLSNGLLLCFGIGAALFVPVVALAGIRMLRLFPLEGLAVACFWPRSARSSSARRSGLPADRRCPDCPQAGAARSPRLRIWRRIRDGPYP